MTRRGAAGATRERPARTGRGGTTMAGKDRVTVRLMREDDLPAMIEIDGIASGNPRAVYLEAKARQALDSEHGLLLSLVAEQEGRGVIGFLMGQVFLGEFGIPETVAWIDTVGVLPDRQKAGVARLMMEDFVTKTRKVGVERVRTMVDQKHLDLMGFFRSMDFGPSSSIVLERKV